MSAILDPRDAALRAHTPVVAVPRFGELAPLERNGHRYLAADDGLWLEVKRPWLRAVLPLAPVWGDEAAWDHALPFGKLERLVQYAISDRDMQILQDRLVADAVLALPNEYAAWGVFDERTGNTDYVRCIARDAGPAGITLHRPKLADHQHFAVDLHSHGHLAACFSDTDDADDAGEVKLAVVAGNVDSLPSWAMRLCVLGIFIEDTAEEAAPA